MDYVPKFAQSLKGKDAKQTCRNRQPKLALISTRSESKCLQMFVLVQYYFLKHIWGLRSEKSGSTFSILRSSGHVFAPTSGPDKRSSRWGLILRFDWPIINHVANSYALRKCNILWISLLPRSRENHIAFWLVREVVEGKLPWKFHFSFHFASKLLWFLSKSYLGWTQFSFVTCTPDKGVLPAFEFPKSASMHRKQNKRN